MEKEEKTSIEDEEEFEPDQEKENFDEVQVKYEVLSEEQERQQELAKADYNADDITVLEGLEPVRMRPGMYIGTTSERGLHHLIREIVDNAVDEALAGYCKNIGVTIHKDNSVTVSDDGRGIPCGIVAKTGKSAVETVYTVLHAGGKFEGSDGYKVSGGLHGVGASVVNALSLFVEVQVKREGIIHLIRFENGGHVVAPGLREIGTCPENETGTQVTFLADPTIFTQTTVYNYSEVRDYLRQTAFLNKGLCIDLYDERTPELTHDRFLYAGGIKEYVAYMNGGQRLVTPTIYYFEGKAQDIFVEAAFQPTEAQLPQIRSFCNNIRTTGGGTHEEGFRLAIGRELNNYFYKAGLNKASGESFKYEDLIEGMTVVISVKHPDPQYEGQVKDKLGNEEVRRVVSSVIGEQLKEYLMEHPDEGKLLYKRVERAYRGRKAAERARQAASKKTFTGSMPDKLADCISKNPEERELFIVEGNSAGGSAKNGRDSYTQAILPLRGKILNVQKAQATRIEKNAEIDNMIQAIGTGINDHFELSKLRYHKIIIMTDADVDGSHIRILLLTFFYRFMKPLVEQGYIYIAQPPLYQLKYAGHEYYCFREEELPVLRSKLPENAKYSLQRYKGLGEMDASQLAETTMEKDRRKLLRVTVQDAEDAETALLDLMGNNVEPRKEYISANAQFAKNLDF